MKIFPFLDELPVAKYAHMHGIGLKTLVFKHEPCRIL